MAEALPVVAVVGRPNVGKSSLVNRILGRRAAIVQETPGVTRDRRVFSAEWAGRSFEVVDTGGLEPGGGDLELRVAEQAEIAIAAADVIVLVVDATAGLEQDDLRVAQRLRAAPVPVVVAANKVDDPADEPAAAVFYRLGLGDPHPLSALHGRGSGDFLDALIEALPESGPAPAPEWATAAIVGRPNVGKSSILNALLGEERSLVDVAAGTTRDPIDEVWEIPDGRRLRIADTAGMRRHTHITDELEYFSYLRARGTLQRVDVVLVVVDASEGVTGADQRLLEEVSESGRACVVALNKWDLVVSDEADRKRFDSEVARKLRFAEWATPLRLSARTGRGIDKIGPALAAAVESHRRRLPTSELNRLIEDAQDARPHPRSRGKAVRVRYAVQAGVSPPTIVLFGNAPITESYRRYLERVVRETKLFPGTPLHLIVRVRSREREGRPV